MLVDKDWYSELKLGNIENIEPVSGGDINLAFKVTSSTGKYFLKVQPNNNASFFDHEVEGLNLINSVANAPKAIRSGTFKGNGYLILEYVEFGTDSEYALGKLVAKMHQKHNDQFGLDHNIKNAKNPKINTWQDNWGDFYVKQRLEVLEIQVKQKGLWNGYRENLLDRLKAKVYEYYSNHPVKPSLMHGDLWNGNAGFQSDHQPILFDPDVFFGNREMDIAMTLLFGGFSKDFYDGYQSVYPLDEGWEDRVSWYQSYYLLAHLNLFGEGYGASLENSLERSISF
ncbi:fructosamine kinase family protein [Companilactobacillus ginsenosidimutans]|uniref:Aminoglycoside phosphotransferase n=1 Tax=Companilactobacillus ginsenosidimutans TaxID=1007676 RepID=A0A0H4QMK9_9LACO|nr:fructosamine kinase family protein [Companilactobacillus ginsenosidimutans]AKP67928.1 aminoglycoside phosphotransferase [Companilactobacillus ginsenosidimutans]